MRKVVFIGSHLGYPMEKTPLGGGAMVGLQLVREWGKGRDFELAVLGSGPQSPDPAGEYHRLPGDSRDAGGLVNLSELEYAAFCRRFERATTSWLVGARGRFPPAETCVVVNDISEGPTLSVLAKAGYPLVSLWHVDVVDYFNKLYLKRLLPPERLTGLYERSRKLGAARALPDVLKLVFEKQRETVVHSRRMIMPSRAMEETVRRCYGKLLKDPAEFSRRSVVVPWGCWEEGQDEGQVRREAEKLREHYQLRPETTVLATVSRISPEKGLDILLEALRLLEFDREASLAGKDLALFVCGEPAFMQGTAYHRRVRRAAQALRKVRVFFPGYLGPLEKAAYLETADLFVSPSVHESYGLSVVEAMRAGLPVLALDHYGVQDVLDDSFGRRVAYPSPRLAPPLLATALKEMLRDPSQLKKMGRAAREAALRMPFSKAAKTVLDTALGAIGEAALT